MAKMVGITLQSLTCEFAGDEGNDLEVGGNLVVHGFDDPAAILETKTIFDFPDGPIRLRQGATATLNKEARMAMATPSVDPPGFGTLFIQFGGSVIEKDRRPDTDDPLGTEWQVLHTNDVINADPRTWHIYFGRNEQIVRADFSVAFLHPL